MLTKVTSRKFTNGEVFLLKTEDGYPLEVTDTFLPFYTKDAVGRKVRISDHWALEDAILEKHKEIIELNNQYADASTYNSMDRYYIMMDRKQLEAELAELVALRPKYALDTDRKTC